ncbi:hypothetical protein CARUB_v10018230mg [Capsella rubella]|uniref:Uncharacterized protein n=1 Tax=Capsella rubella TaxID=81985 RepID=R0HM14_9BRAS|nr:vacuolar protein sorting-associated protein 32 homolog 2 [Capsella rubella]EOA24938.1 hypothetical protein CARUB_v10018230mg [Capsella rubella]
MMMVTWLAGKPCKSLSELHKSIVVTKKHLESLEQWEKDCLEKAAINLEKAREHCRKYDRDDALYCLKLKRLHERTAQTSRNLQLPVRIQLVSMERVKDKLTEAMRDKDHTTKKTIQVFIYFSLLLLILAYFV